MPDVSFFKARVDEYRKHRYGFVQNEVLIVLINCNLEILIILN